MKKIISLFQRNYETDHLVRDEIVPGAEWVVAGEGVATRKFDGTCCMVRDGKLYRRFDAKNNKEPAKRFEPALDTIRHCVVCLKAIQDNENISAPQAIQKPMAETPIGKRPGIQSEAAGEQGASSAHLPGVQDAVQGTEGTQVLQQQVCAETRLENRDDERLSIGSEQGRLSGYARIPAHSDAVASEREQPGVCVRASHGNGKEAGSKSDNDGMGASQERGQVGQQAFKSGNRDALKTPWTDYLSALPNGISTALKCPHCGANKSTMYIIPDSTTGHWPGWLPVSDGPEDKWHRESFELLKENNQGEDIDGSYELIGPKIQGNPENSPFHLLIRHGRHIVLDAPRTFNALLEWFKEKDIEGIVWHHPDGRMVKIKKKDFGFKR